jgi:hypothetical protein
MNVASPKLKPVSRPSYAVAEVRADDLERRRELGQFFTSPEVAGFIWELLEVIHGKRFHANTRLLDPACGEGVFLRVAHERGGLPAKSLFGADIDEALAPGWRRDPLLRDANVVAANGLLDDPASGIVAGAFNVVAGNPPFSGKGLRDLLRLLEESPEGERHEEQDLFGATYLKEAATPPREPLSRSERADLDRLARNLSRYSCWRLETEPEPDDEADEESESAPTELFAADALFDRRRPTASDYEQAAQLIAYWPDNRLLDTSRPEIRDTIRRLASTAIEVMFTERFVRLAKPGGLSSRAIAWGRSESGCSGKWICSPPSVCHKRFSQESAPMPKQQSSLDAAALTTVPMAGIRPTRSTMSRTKTSRSSWRPHGLMHRASVSRATWRACWPTRDANVTRSGPTRNDDARTT